MIGSFARTALVPVSFAPGIPRDVPYVVMRDRDDRVDEELALAGIAALPLATTSILATEAFAPLSWWWWYCPAFSDVDGGMLALGPQHFEMLQETDLRDALLEVAWIATPIGGRFRIGLAGDPHEFDTNAPRPVWRSALLHLGPVRRGDTLTLDALDPTGAVAIRALRITTPDAVERAARDYRALVAGARTTVVLAEPARTFHPLRVGSGRGLGRFAFRRVYRLRAGVLGRGGWVAVVDRFGNLVAFKRVGRGVRAVTLLFEGVDDPLQLIGPDRAVRWQLEESGPLPDAALPPRLATAWRARPSPGTVAGTSAKIASSRRVAALNVTYSQNWICAPNCPRHFATALGTNAWVVDDPGALRIVDRQTPVFHVAFIVGLLAFVGALFGSLVTRLRTT